LGGPLAACCDRRDYASTAAGERVRHRAPHGSRADDADGGHLPSSSALGSASASRHMSGDGKPVAVSARPYVGVPACSVPAIRVCVRRSGVDDGHVAQEADAHVVGFEVLDQFYLVDGEVSALVVADANGDRRDDVFQLHRASSDFSLRYTSSAMAPSSAGTSVRRVAARATPASLPSTSTRVSAPGRPRVQASLRVMLCRLTRSSFKRASIFAIWPGGTRKTRYTRSAPPRPY